MTTALKLRRGTTSQHSTFTGAAGEVTVDTTKNAVVVHDGATAGGFPLSREGHYTGFKNRIINGDMRIDQRNAGASVTIPSTGSQFTLDRFNVQSINASKFSVQQNAGGVTAPAGFSNYLGITSLAATSSAAGDYYSLIHAIEGFNTADLNWGSANAKTVTLSFRVYSSLTGTFGGAVRNSADNYSYPFTYSIPVANTWTTISVTIAGPTSGTWVGATNGIGARIVWNLGTGSNYLASSGASWQGANYYGVTGNVSVVGTSGATWYMTGAQLEVGSSATPFDTRAYGTELALCQRYAQKWIGQGLSTQGNIGCGLSTNVTSAAISLNPVVPMRASPTASHSSLVISDSATYDLAVSVVTVVNFNGLGLFLDVTHAGTASTFRPCHLRPASSTAGYLLLSSEL